MKALLLSAGLGSRLRPVSDRIPKCLVPVQGKPLLAYWFDLLFAGGIEQAIVNTHHLASAVEAFCRASPWCDRVVLVPEATLLGTAGTLVANRQLYDGEAVLVAHSDNLSRFSVRDFIECHQKRARGAVLTMMTFDSDRPEACGIVETDSEGLVRGFHEKVPNPPGRRANAAVYIIEPEVVEYAVSLRKRVIDFSTEIIPAFLGRMTTFHNADYHRDIGTPESLRLAEIEYCQVS